MPDKNYSPGSSQAEPKVTGEAAKARGRIKEESLAQLELAEKRGRLRQLANRVRERLGRGRRDG